MIDMNAMKQLYELIQYRYEYNYYNINIFG